MGKREKKLKAAKVEELSSSEEENKKAIIPIEAIDSDDDEANEDLSLKIVKKSMLRACNKNPQDDGVSEIVTDVQKVEKKKKEKKKRKKNTETELPKDAVPSEIDTGFKDFCGELFLVDNVIGEEKPHTDEAALISDIAVEANPVQVSDNAVLRKLLRGPRYFDPPDNSWGACYNCGEEGHTTVNCTSARRKKPCFVCGSFEHNAKQCTKGRDCFICKQQGHRAKDCPEKYKSSKICLKCGDLEHDMFSCRNDYCPEDLKEIQCYICQGFGHLCCANYGGPGPKEVSCYRCGLSGHTGLACTGGYRGDTNVGTVSANSCYKCGEEGHFARECTSSNKSGKRNREPSTPKQNYPKKKDYREAKSAPHDLDKKRKKKYQSQHEEFSSVMRTKHRGGWSTKDPGDFYSSKPQANNWRSPTTPRDRRANYSSSNGGDYASTPHYSRNPHYNLDYHNYPSNGSSGYHQHSSGYYQHRFSASRFGNSSNDGMRRDYNW